MSISGCNYFLRFGPKYLPVNLLVRFIRKRASVPGGSPVPGAALSGIKILARIKRELALSGMNAPEGSAGNILGFSGFTEYLIICVRVESAAAHLRSVIFVMARCIKKFVASCRIIILK